MRRTALRFFFERIVVASLPLVFAGCEDDSVEGADLSSQVVTPRDFSFDTSPDGGHDTCERLHPQTDISIPDGGIEFPAGGNLCYFLTPCEEYCPPGYDVCCGPIAVPGGMILQCFPNCGAGGRRPSGLLHAKAGRGCSVGQHFAQMAHLEAAAVHAFRTLAREIEENGAPVRLVRDARRAVADEVRHTRMMARLARAHRATPAPVEIVPSQKRSLAELAMENALEGCVRETFGALVASWQARAAQDPVVRDVMKTIAEDETRHAELAWAVDAWVAPRLDAGMREEIRRARRQAASALLAEVADLPSAMVQLVGLPSASHARQLIFAASKELWS